MSQNHEGDKLSKEGIFHSQSLKTNASTHSYQDQSGFRENNQTIYLRNQQPQMAPPQVYPFYHNQTFQNMNGVNPPGQFLPNYQQQA